MRRLLVSVGIGVGGMAVLVAGLLWDALLHARDPGLAAREGLFTLSNPGHLLLAVGIGLALVGMLAAGDAALSLREGRTWGAGGPRRAAVAVAALVVVGAAVTGTWAGREGHEHGEVAAGGAGIAGGHHDAPVPVGGGPAAADAAGGAEPHGHAEGHGQADTHGHGSSVGVGGAEPTAEQRAAADRLRTATMAAARRWTSRDAAQADGFRPITPVLNGLQHWHNQRFFTDGRVLEPSAPEELIYASTSRGPVLVAAMYLMERLGERGPQIGGPLTVWHDHEDLCFSSDGRVVGFHRPPRSTCPPGSVNQRTPEMLHVWIVDNPAGDFAAEMEPAALLAIAERGATG